MLWRFLIKMSVLSILLSIPVFCFAKARPHHQHEDLFAEDDLLLGFKAGPQIADYTPIQTNTQTIGVQSAPRFQLGVAAKFIYGFPRFEFDLFWSTRGGIEKSSDTIHSFALPFLVKLPWEVEENVDLEIGGGVEERVLVAGPNPRRSWTNSVLASLGVSVDFVTYVFEFDLRYLHGLDTIDDTVNGAQSRDFQMIGGLLWHF